MNRLVRSLCFFLLCPQWLLAQGTGSSLIKFNSGITDVVRYEEDDKLYSQTVYSWEITRADNGDKTFTFMAKNCVYFSEYLLGHIHLVSPVCTALSKSEASRLAPIVGALADFDNFAPTARHFIVMSTKRRPPAPKRSSRRRRRWIRSSSSLTAPRTSL